MNKVDLREAFGRFQETWTPYIIAQVQDMHVKLARIQGEFVWHKHDEQDELFFVVGGRMTLRFRDRDVELEPGQLCVVPRGQEHMPVAPEECQILLLEPAGTRNTGDVDHELTKEGDRWLEVV